MVQRAPPFRAVGCAVAQLQPLPVPPCHRGWATVSTLEQYPSGHIVTLTTAASLPSRNLSLAMGSRQEWPVGRWHMEQVLLADGAQGRGRGEVSGRALSCDWPPSSQQGSRESRWDDPGKGS